MQHDETLTHMRQSFVSGVWTIWVVFSLPLSETLSETLSSRIYSAGKLMFTHHKLRVYEKALAFGADLDLYQQKAYPAQVETAQGRELLSRILAMLNKF